MSNTEHSDIMGGSTAAQRIHCPGSYQLQKDTPRVTSEYAEEGTALHHAIEYYLLKLPEGASPAQLVGMVFNNITITDEHIKSKIQPALDAFKEICDHYGGGLDFMVEVKGSLSEIIPGAFGTIDILGRFPNGKLLVLDWKFGDGIPVKPEANMQLAFYAACALYTDDPEITDLVGVDGLDIVFAIVQPRRGVDGDCYDTWETTDEWVEDFIDQAKEAYTQAIGDSPPLKTGDHCRWCRAQTVCPEKNKQIGAAVSAPPSVTDAVTLSKQLQVANELESWIKEVRKIALADLKNGVKIPGWKLVPKRAQRQYTDKKKAEGLLCRKLKVAGAYQERKLISPAQAEIKLGKEYYNKYMAKYVAKVSSGDTMAPDTDSRPDVSDPLTQLGSATKEKPKSLFDK